MATIVFGLFACATATYWLFTTKTDRHGHVIHEGKAAPGHTEAVEMGWGSYAGFTILFIMLIALSILAARRVIGTWRVENTEVVYEKCECRAA